MRVVTILSIDQFMETFMLLAVVTPPRVVIVIALVPLED